MSTFSPRSSLVTMRTRAPRAPTQAPTGSTFGSFDHTAIFVRWPGSRAAALSLDNAAGDLGHFELEQALDQARVGAGHHDLRALGGLADFDDVGLETRAVLVALVGHLLGLGHQRFDFAQVKQGVAVVALLDDAGDDVALAAGVLLVLHVALGLANALQHDLLRGLRGDTAEVLGRVVPLADDVAVLVEFLAVHLDLAGVGVDRDDGFFGGGVEPLVRGDQRVRERVEQVCRPRCPSRGRVPGVRRGNLRSCVGLCVRVLRMRFGRVPALGLRRRAPRENGAGPFDVGVRETAAPAP